MKTIAKIFFVLGLGITTAFFSSGFGVNRTVAAEGGKTIILYYSWSGNSAAIAKEIQRSTGGELLQIEPVTPYPAQYNACLAEARKEAGEDRDRPLKTVFPTFAPGMTAYVCFPIWNGTIPTPIITMFRQNSFDGVHIMPVASHGGGGAGRSTAHIRSLAPGTTVTEALAVRGKALPSNFDEWVSANIK